MIRTLQNSYLNIFFKNEKFCWGYKTSDSHSWTNPTLGKNGWIKHQNDLTSDLPGKAPWLPLLLLYLVNNSFTASLISHLQLSYISLMWDDWLAQLHNLTYHMNSILLDQFHRRFSVLSQLCLSNTIVELTVTFWKLSLIKNYKLLRVFLGRLDCCTPLSGIAKFEISLYAFLKRNVELFFFVPL